MVAQYFKAADAARIKNNVVRGLGAACGGRADLLRAIPSEDDHVFSKTPGETTKTPGDTLAGMRLELHRLSTTPRVLIRTRPGPSEAPTMTKFLLTTAGVAAVLTLLSGGRRYQSESF